MKRKLSEENDIHVIGYHVFNNAISIGSEIEKTIAIQSKKINAPIFNNIKNDNKRLQSNLVVKSKCMKMFISNLNNFVKENCSTKLVPTDYVLLKSLSGCQDQDAHTDYEPAKI